jgi:uncharacterized repeat protein (TIGR01451 family)
MQCSLRQSRSLKTLACTAIVALTYGGASRPSATILRTETRLPFSTAVEPTATTRTAAGDLLGRLPLAFERNDGQLDGRVRFSARGEAYEVALGPLGATLALSDRTAPGSSAQIAMRFLDARPAREMYGVEPLQGRSHYYRGNDAAAWPTDVPTFGRVRARGVYKGIDVEYYGRNRQLEYDFLVAPGADPSQIALAFEGVDRLSIDQTGDLLLQVGPRTIRQHRPVAWQDTKKGRRAVDADYLLLGRERVVIALGEYDRELALVIDPVLAYASYFGGNSDDQVRAVAVDGFGNIYLTGVTQSTNFPLASAAQGSKAGTAITYDAFVTKLNPAGTTVFFSTYLGGTGNENVATETAGSIAVDANGAVYIAGDTASADFPATAGAFQPTYGAGTNSPADGFVAKLSATGTLTFASYLGGTDVDHINGVAVATDGDVVVSGRTRSTTLEGFPLVNARDTTLSGNADIFVTRIESTGASLVFSTYIGGSGDELSFYRSGHALDAQGNVFVSGLTSSVDYPTTAGVIRTVRTNSTYDGFITKLSADGQNILASTWFGGANGENNVADVAIAPGGDAVIAGDTAATAGFPATNAFQSTHQGGLRDGFVARLNNTLTGIVFATYFGGNDRDVAKDVTVDVNGGIHVVGTTRSPVFPLVQPVQNTLANGNDAFIAKFSPQGTPTFSSYLGSLQVNEEGMAVGATPSGDTVAAGWTAGENFPRVNPYQNVFQGGFTDGWLARVGPGADLGVTKGANRQTAEPGAQITYTISVSNSGPDAASDVTVIDTLPTSVTFQSCTASSGGVCANIGNAVTVHFDTLPLNNSATITLIARVNGLSTPGAAIVNTAFVQTPTSDPNAANNTASNTVTVVAPDPAGDTDADGLPNGWESQYGLDPTTGDASADPDNDGRTNLQEYQQGTHPRGFVITYFAEGATGAFFDTMIALANPSNTQALVLLRFQKDNGEVVRLYKVVAPHSRATVDVDQVAGMAETAFSTLIEADVQIVADRTMSWDQTGYGGHTERGTLTRAASTWYLAEGATGEFFDLFYLIQNPGDAATTVEVTFLLAGDRAPIVKSYPVGPQTRFTLYVDEVPGLAIEEVSAVVRSTNGAPIVVERAMYGSQPGQPFAAGHNSAGVTAPATRWFLAEGATGSFFDLFVLIANPSAQAAEVDVEFLLTDGGVVSRHYRLAANSRFTIPVDSVDPQLEFASLSTIVTSANDVPIVVERVMWWPSPNWSEAHNSPGETTTGVKWALAEGEIGGPREKQTYILVANTSAFAGSARVTLLFEDGTTAERVVQLQAKSRVNVAVNAETFPTAVNRRFGTVVESLGATPAQIVVERALYWNANGVVWAAGTNALATKIQ